VPLIDYGSSEGDAYHHAVHQKFLADRLLVEAWAARALHLLGRLRREGEIVIVAQRMRDGLESE